MTGVTAKDLRQRVGLTFLGTRIDAIKLDLENRTGQHEFSKNLGLVLFIGVFLTFFTSIPLIFGLFDSDTTRQGIIEAAKLPLAVIVLTALILVPVLRYKTVIRLHRDGVAIEHTRLFGREERFIPWPEFLGANMRVHKIIPTHNDDDRRHGKTAKTRYFQIVELIHPDPKYWLPVLVQEGNDKLPRKAWEQTARQLNLPACVLDGDSVQVRDAGDVDSSIAERVSTGRLNDSFDTSAPVPDGVATSMITAYGDQAIRVDINKPTPQYFRLIAGILLALLLIGSGIAIPLVSGDWVPLPVLGLFGLLLLLICGARLATQRSPQYLLITPERIRHRETAKPPPESAEAAAKERASGSRHSLYRDGIRLAKIEEVRLLSESGNAIIKLVTDRADLTIPTALSGKDARWLRDYLTSVIAKPA